jgi:methionine synthase II (cobalamin-independent)
MDFNPNFQTTHVGSLPHREIDDAICHWLLDVVDIPTWPQLPRRSFRESIYNQYSAGLPGLVIDNAQERIYLDTSGDLTGPLESFYDRCLRDEVDSFALGREEAAGFWAMLDCLRAAPGEWAKGQVMGPFSFGLTVTDQNQRASLYNETLADTIVKNIAMKARWQVRQLRAVRPNVLMCVDEPYMVSWGSAYVNVSGEQVRAMLEEVLTAIHQEGALAGVHCCGNTDWSLLLGTSIDFLNLDAYNCLEQLALYPEELRAFLDRGGVVAWGIVPNTEEIYNVTPRQLAERLWRGLESMEAKAIGRGVPLLAAEFARRSLITPSCGLGPTTPEVAVRVLDSLREAAEAARK